MAPKQKPTAAATTGTDGEKERYTKLIVASAEKAPEKIRPYLVTAAPFLAQAIVLIIIAVPYLVKGCKMLEAGYKMLPDRILWAVVGFLVCFCGGVFPATIAAVEAWNLCGGQQAIAQLTILYGQLCHIAEENVKDDAKDNDGDGVADVNQLDGKALLVRKAGVVLKTTDPEVVGGAVNSIYTGWIGVVAILKIQFARTVTLGDAIGTQMYSQAKRVEPMLIKMLPEDYHAWVPCVVRWTCKSIAITIAWWIQRVISAFHSAIRGGLMCARSLVNFANEQGYINFNDEESQLDEIAGWSLAAVGLLFQFYMRFSVPFPLNLLTWPVSIVETFIVYSVSS